MGATSMKALLLTLLLFPLTVMSFENNVDIDTGKEREYLFYPNDRTELRILQYENLDVCVFLFIDGAPQYINCVQPQ